MYSFSIINVCRVEFRLTCSLKWQSISLKQATLVKNSQWFCIYISQLNVVFHYLFPLRPKMDQLWSIFIVLWTVKELNSIITNRVTKCCIEPKQNFNQILGSVWNLCWSLENRSKNNTIMESSRNFVNLKIVTEELRVTEGWEKSYKKSRFRKLDGYC